MRVVCLHNAIDENSPADEKDVLDQLSAVQKALLELGHSVEAWPVNLDLGALYVQLKTVKPELIFNLVESLEGIGRFIHFLPAILEELKIPFTGSGSQALFLTTDKVLSKKLLRQAGLPTPVWFDLENLNLPSGSDQAVFLIKPVAEDASVGIDEDDPLLSAAEARQKLLKLGANYFAEEYIDGREFNLSLLQKKDGVEVLPPAEMVFKDYPSHAPKIVGYRAKWDASSFEYQHTVRRFVFGEEDKFLLENLKKLALECWQLFGLRGYARVDFRVDAKGQPYILEVNANPCIAPDSGFVAAVLQGGYSYKEMIDFLVQAAKGEGK